MAGPVSGTDNGVGYGVLGKTNKNNGVGVRGTATNGLAGVLGSHPSNLGVLGRTDSGQGVRGESNSGEGVLGLSENAVGVFGRSNGTGGGVLGYCKSGDGVVGISESSDGVSGISRSRFAVRGESETGEGVFGRCGDGTGIGVHGIGSVQGVLGETSSGNGVVGVSTSGHGLIGESSTGNGVRGFSDTGNGAVGVSNNTGTGLWGISLKGAGVDAESLGWHALYARAWDENYYTAYLDGNVIVTGNLQKSGGGFKIDHPVDPSNKYLSHSFVESPDMKNMYDGVVVLDRKGEAKIDLPDWLSALNKDFRYQLTAIGSPAPNLYIAEQISGATRSHRGSSTSKNNKKNYFKVGGDTSGMKVSWQVTGTRKDAWSNAHRIKVEQDKPSNERGYYLYPHLYNRPEKKG